MTPKTRNKPGRPPDEALQARRREEILDAAAKLFAEHGYPDTDVGSVAAHLGIGKGTVYRYYPSKRDLFLAAVDRGMARLHETIIADTAHIPDPLDRIVAAIRAFLAYFEAHPELVELFLQERAQFKDRPVPAYFAHHAAHEKPWRDLYQSLIDAGRVREVPGGPDCSVVNDLLYGTILANHVTGRRVPADVQARNIIDLIFHGLLTDRERVRRHRP